MLHALTVADLSRPPQEVVRALASWQRGDVDDAVAEALVLSARSTFQRAYTAWIWCGQTPSAEPASILPIEVRQVARFTPATTMTVVTRTLRAAVAAGADPSAARLLDWHGFVAIVTPGVDPVLLQLALEEHHPRPATVSASVLPPGSIVDGPPVELGPLPASTNGAGLVEVAHATRVHPVPIALELLSQGWGLEEQHYPDELVDRLRHRGYQGPALDREAASLAIEDDPCPRRRHARRVLRRLLHARKIGAQYHTEFGHLARGIAPEARADALQIGEALVRAGLLGEKPSVGQRHVYLNREALPAIHALIERGATSDPALAREWTAPPPG